MQYLSLHNNDIAIPATLDFTDCTHLETLILNGNEFTFVDVENLINLSYLQMIGCNLGGGGNSNLHYDFTSNSGLETLEIWGNQIQEIELDNPNLKTAHIGGNPLQGDIFFNKCSKL